MHGQGCRQGQNCTWCQQSAWPTGYANLDRNINNDNLNWQMQRGDLGLNIYDRQQQASNGSASRITRLQNAAVELLAGFL